jgi:hypothetical protein
MAEGIVGNLTRAWECTHKLAYCDPVYLRQWSPVEKAAASAPAMLLAASGTGGSGPMSEIVARLNISRVALARYG